MTANSLHSKFEVCQIIVFSNQYLFVIDNFIHYEFQMKAGYANRIASTSN